LENGGEGWGEVVNIKLGMGDGLRVRLRILAAAAKLDMQNVQD
jgi:hypothetical protein